ncbi:MAG TPA: ATP-binding protein [Bacteroidales bacterium]|nr:ATP-binding protein [Bacteroidales bacterium]
MNSEFNPFPVSGYYGADYFCDRDSETNLIRRNIRNNINTTLFSVRRLGKTGLIHHIIESYSKDRQVVCLYIDIFSSTCLMDFTNVLATVIFNRFPENNTIGKKVMKAIASLRPVISYDTLSGDPEVRFEYMGASQYEKTLQQLFSFLDGQGKKIVFAIDEFQQILEYPEKNMEAVLRTHIQRLKNTFFIFSGSNQKMMHEIFNNQKRPFYASCSNVNLGFIDENIYADFIRQKFKQHKRSISDECIRVILEFTHRHTFYTQYFCNHLFASGIKSIAKDDVYAAAIEILKLNESTCFQYRSLLTKAQWQLLTALAKEERLQKAHSASFLKKYLLGTSAHVTRGMAALIEKDLVYHNTSVEQPYYTIYDKFLMRWLQRL